MKKKKFLFSLLMAIVMMAMSPQRMWATNVSYRIPVYNTAGDPSSGFKGWETKTVDATQIASSSSHVTLGTAGQESWYYVSGTVTLSNGVSCEGAIHLILCDGAKLTATGINEEDGGYRCYPGIQVTGDNSLTIYAQSEGPSMGALEAFGYSQISTRNKYFCSAGIGGDSQEEGKNITINGGKITAAGAKASSYFGAGIGGGFTGMKASTARWGASNNHINPALTTKAGSSANPTGVVTNTGGDLASTLNNYQYVTVHLHGDGTPTWNWADDGSNATLTIPCSFGDGSVTLSATTTPAVSITSETTTQLTCATAGTTTYNASVTYNGITYNAPAKQVVTPATGKHAFGTDATRSVCTVCNHGFFRYSSTDNNPVTPYKASKLLGADGNALSFTNKYVEAEGKCVMEFNEPLVTIGDFVFRECNKFTGDLIIPNSVKNIEFEAFRNCGFTGTLSIGSSVESIGNMAFLFCNNFTYVEMKSVPSVGISAIDNNANKTLVLSDDSYVNTGSNANFPTINSFSYPRTVTGGNIVTFVLPVSVPVSSINGKVWKFSTYEDDKFKFTAVTDDNTEANVPYLVQLDESATELLDGTITGDLTINAPFTPKVIGADGHVMHIGSYTKQSVVSDEYSAYYGFSQASHQFVKAKSGTLNPFRTMFAIVNDNVTRFDDWTSLNSGSWGDIDTSLDGDEWSDNTRDYTFTAKAGDELSFNYKVISDGTYKDYGHLNVYLCNGTPTFDNYNTGEKILEKYGDFMDPCVTGEYNKVFDTKGEYTLVFEYVAYMATCDDDKAWITNIKLTPLASSSANNAKAYIDLQLGMDDDDATKIIRVDADAITGTGSPMYNLQGQRITNPVKGQVYIQNGKKVLSK